MLKIIIGNLILNNEIKLQNNKKYKEKLIRILEKTIKYDKMDIMK